ncbi:MULTISPECIES: DUF4185 domain-containing protein [unclassified Dietzia]|uniref:DUF4185 domain-containing protein n=1 Tax=unclassified Dietzia TaxID=2617939 RepID=UPI000D213F44|nr:MULTISPECIES: DUF4185 domain-containing protein [unclassified Dietzia]AVZ39283.1 hypothetical protein CT688_07145 [Dietzia sp. JS16-p6b]QGW24525.1 hypothetical protein GJR88_02292 [Dietzia sp. DQ12-45-1b]
MSRALQRLAATALAAVAASVAAIAVTGSGTATAGPCSVMFGNFGSLLENQTGAGMGGGSLGPPGSGSTGPLGSASRALGSADRSGSLVQQLETGSLGNGLSGSLDTVTGSVYGMPPWITGEEGTVPVLRGPTQFLQLVTGPTGPADTVSRYGVTGTDLGIMWDNGHATDPEILMAFGDTMGDCTLPGSQWRSNVLFRSGDTDLGDGLSIDSAATGPDGLAKSIVPRSGLPGEVTIIPTAGIAIEGVQYLRFMSIAHWGQPGSWTTNYSGLAYSTDNGENWTVVPALARPITSAVPVGDGAPPVDPVWRDSQMSSYLTTDTHLYEYLTPSGRQGSAILARVPLAGSPSAEDLDAAGGAPPAAGVLDPAAYRYWDGAEWVDDPSDAAPVLPRPASELSVMWNRHLGKYIAMYSQGYNSVVIRTADRPEGPWTGPTALVDYSMLPGVYGAFMHPWAQGEDLYYLVTTWNAYNVFLVRTRLSDVLPSRLRSAAAPAGPAASEVVRHVPVSELVDGAVPTE